MTRIKNPQDFWSGLLFLIVGSLALWFGRNYQFGAATKMGPGYLPTVLSWTLAGLGLFLTTRGLLDNGPALEKGILRPQFFILSAIVVFALTIERFGLAPTVFVVTILAALASPEMRWKETVVVAVGLAVLCVLLFVKLLGQPLTIWSWSL